MLDGLFRRMDWTLDVRCVELWGERGDRLVRSGKLRLALRAIRLLPLAAWRFIRAPKPDVLFVGYPGHLDMLYLAPMARVRGVPVVFDVFLSLYDTVVSDRRLVSARSAWGRLLAWIDRTACRLADQVLVDTPVHGAYLAGVSGAPPDRFRVLWIGAEEQLFQPRDVEPEPGRVLFYGTYIPLHGLTTIIRSSKLLEGRPIRFRIIGSGQQRAEIGRLVEELGLENVDLLDPVPLERLPDEIARASLCLGIFGESGKASRVIPNKVFQAVAMGCPVLTADTPAVRSAFSGEEIALVPPGDPEALAAAIDSLLGHPDQTRQMGLRGRERYLRDYSQGALARVLDGHLADLVRSLRSRRVGSLP